MNAPTTHKELQNIVDNLPPFSKQVYQALQATMYAEPGYSDTTVADLAKRLNCKPMAVNGAIGHLTEAGLVYSVQDSGSDTPDTFLHTYEHDNEIKPENEPEDGGFTMVITIECRNAAFQDAPRHELKKILEGLADDFMKKGAQPNCEQYLYDSNGNQVGNWNTKQEV